MCEAELSELIELLERDRKHRAREIATVVATIMNSAGKSFKDTIQVEDLIRNA
jgi:predicted nucleic-acid-binding protein